MPWPGIAAHQKWSVLSFLVRPEWVRAPLGGPDATARDHHRNSWTRVSVDDWSATAHELPHRSSATRPRTSSSARVKRSASAGSEVVRIAGLQAGPLDDGTSTGTVRVLAVQPLGPAARRVFPLLLPPVDGQVEQPIAVVHRFNAAPRCPVGLEDTGSSSQVANDVHHAHTTSNQEGVARVQGRVPRHIPAHELAVPSALFVRALAEHGE